MSENALILTIHFSGAMKKVFVDSFTLLLKTSDHVRTGNLIRRLSYLSSSLFPSGNFRANVLASLKSLNKLPNTRVFIAAEKWMVRTTGVRSVISLQNRNLRC